MRGSPDRNLSFPEDPSSSKAVRIQDGPKVGTAYILGALGFLGLQYFGEAFASDQPECGETSQISPIGLRGSEHSATPKPKMEPAMSGCTSERPCQVQKVGRQVGQLEE